MILDFICEIELFGILGMDFMPQKGFQEGTK